LAFKLANANPSIQQGGGRREGTLKLLEFVRGQFGEEAYKALRQAAEKLPAELGGLEAQAQPSR